MFSDVFSSLLGTGDDIRKVRKSGSEGIQERRGGEAARVVKRGGGRGEGKSRGWE